jgi:hypothetical protein
VRVCGRRPRARRPWCQPHEQRIVPGRMLLQTVQRRVCAALVQLELYKHFAARPAPRPRVRQPPSAIARVPRRRWWPHLSRSQQHAVGRGRVHLLSPPVEPDLGDLSVGDRGHHVRGARWPRAPSRYDGGQSMHRHCVGHLGRASRAAGPRVQRASTHGTVRLVSALFRPGCRLHANGG